MSDQELRLACLELTNEDSTIESRLTQAKQLYNFLYGHSDAELDAAIATLKI